MRNLIFPSNPIKPKTIDPSWEKEATAAKEAGFGISLLSDFNTSSGPLTVSNRTADKYLYRGWLLKPQFYEEMVQSVGDAPLLTGFVHYMWAYSLPNWYHYLETKTPHSITYVADDVVKMGLESIAQQVAVAFQGKSVVVKDFLKSRKHEWFDACFIKDHTDIKDSVRVMTNFFNLQGRDFFGGLVFREFLQLKKLGTHPKSGMPLPVEFRTFFLHQKPILTTPYWDNDILYPEVVEAPPTAWLESIGEKMLSPFVALDIAQDENDNWWVIEVNDGGSAGYPDSVNSKEFYQTLYQNC